MTDLDPFSSENAPKVALIVQMRLYDALMAVLREINPDAFSALHSIHEQGGLLGALPYLNLVDD